MATGVGAGLAGLAAGAVIGGALSSGYGYGYGDQAYGEPVYQPEEQDAYAAPVVSAGGDTTEYCMQQFKSYDPASGTYLGYDGFRHPCP